MPCSIYNEVDRFTNEHLSTRIETMFIKRGKNVMLDYCVMNQVRYTEIRALNVIHTHLMGPVPQILSCNLGHLLCTCQ